MLIEHVSDDNPNSYGSINEFIVKFNDMESIELEKVHIEGTFRHDLELRLTPRTNEGLSGDHIITPIKLHSGKYLLVNRGWVPSNIKKGDPELEITDEEVTFTGFVRLDQKVPMVMPTNTFADETINYLNVAEIKNYYDDLDDEVADNLLPFYVLEKSDTDVDTYPVPVNIALHLANNHLQYAITWFLLAFCMLIIYIVYVRHYYKDRSRSKKRISR